jgi:cob(I)alamin adenosyltransferase
VQIYTRKGDDGTTGLFHGGRVRKDDPRPHAYGEVDEAQAAIGVARAALVGADGVVAGADAALAELLLAIGRDLYVLMAELATAPANRSKLVAGSSLVTPEMVAALEPRIDAALEGFEHPKEFVVPGGEIVAAHLDVARCVVRRAERATLAVAAEGSSVVPYLNRLSDLLWALARVREAGQHGGRGFEFSKDRT